MKIRIFTTLFTWIVIFTSCGQNPEEQKLIDAIRHKQDSMMNTPEMREMMKQVEEQEKQIKEAQEKKQTKEIVSEVKTVSSDDWYWNNTMKSTNSRFEHWTYGTADIVMMYRMEPNQLKPRRLKIGTIDKHGAVKFELPNSVNTQSKLSSRQNILFYDIKDISSLEYSNEATGFFANAYLFVMNGEKELGRLTLGNSVRVTYNLVNQSSLYQGDEGFLVYWVYAEDACSLNGIEVWNGDVRRDGTKTRKVETTVQYDLNFKKGWSLVKTEVIGKYQLDHERGLDISWFKNHTHSVLSSIPSDAEFFFRTINN